MTASLETLGRGTGLYSARQLKQVQNWVDDDWESGDHDENLVRVVRRLVHTASRLLQDKIWIIWYAAEQKCCCKRSIPGQLCGPCRARLIVPYLPRRVPVFPPQKT